MGRLIMFALYVVGAVGFAYYLVGGPERSRQTAAESPEAQFVKAAAVNGASQLELSYDALELARSADVRKFAQQIVDAQRPMLGDLEQLAAERGVVIAPIPEPPAERAQGDRPTRYDEAYLRREIELHEEALALFGGEATGGLDSNLRAYAWMNAAQIEQRLQAARGIADRLARAAKR